MANPGEKVSVPRHLAVIMDGNGRWARARGLPRLEGHRAGAEAVREITTACAELGVGYLTLYTFSAENWRRPRAETSGLMRYLRHYLKAELPVMQKNRIRFHSIGDEAGLPAGVVKALERTRRATADNPGMRLILALNYGSRQEIVAAARSFAREVARGAVDPESLNEEVFSGYLHTAGFPDPDLVIRTSGEMRLSNFLLWQISYAEIVVSDVLWPDFGREDLLAAFAQYTRRERRFGGHSPEEGGKCSNKG